MSSFAVVGGVNRKVTKRYATIDGVHRKIKSRYAVVDGVYRKVWSGDLGLFIASSYIYSSSYNEMVALSKDGITWEMHTITVGGNNVSTHIKSMTYGNGVVVAVFVFSDGPYLAYSYDGINYTLVNMPSGTTNMDDLTVCYGNGIFVAISNSGIKWSSTLYSYDGIIWTVGPSIENTSIGTLRYVNGYFIYCCSNTKGFYSTDGITWTMRTHENNSVGYCFGIDVTYAFGKFIFLDYYDGKYWYADTLLGTRTQGGAFYSGASGIGSNGNDIVTTGRYTLTDITTKVATDLTNANTTWEDITYGQKKFVCSSASLNASGWDDYIAYSIDGITWTKTKIVWCDSTGSMSVGRLIYAGS